MRIKKKELMYYLGIFLLYLVNIQRSSLLINFSEKIGTIILLSGYLALTAQIFINNRKIKDLIVIVFVILIGIFLYQKTGQSIILTLILILVSSKNVQIDKVIKFIFILNLFILIVHIGVYCCYYLFQKESLEFIFRNQKIRHSFFFSHPNPFSGYVFWETVMYIYLKRKMGLVDYIFTLLISIFIYLFPNSKTTAICLILLPIFNMLFMKINIKNIITKFLISNIFTILTVFFIFSMLFYKDSTLIKNIDLLFSTRIKLASAVNDYYGLTMFGQKLPYGEDIEYMAEYKLDGITLDSTYYYILFSFGIIVFIVYLFIMKRTFKILYENGENNKILFLLLLAIFSTMESWCLNPILTFPLFFILEKRNKGDRL